MHRFLISLILMSTPPLHARDFAPSTALAASQPQEQAASFAGIFSDGMVLQAGMPLRFWGSAAPGSELVVSFAGQQGKTRADDAGQWSLELPALAPNGTGQELALVAGERRVVLKDVLVGEVWICSGQSNMEWALNKLGSAGTEAIAAAELPQLRLFSIDRTTAPSPAASLSKFKPWVACSPASVVKTGTHGAFSATAFHFGRKLQQELGVPVGLIQSAWGGTSIQSWTPADAVTDAKTPKDTAVRYNAMIAPLSRLSCRGVIWYQGENNIASGRDYGPKMQGMIEGWRKNFGRPDLSFYAVELASFRYNKTRKVPEDTLTLLRMGQLDALRAAGPLAGLAHSLDVADDVDNIHPLDKRSPGERLARLALAKTYKKPLGKSLAGPEFLKTEVRGGDLVVHFSDTAGALKAADAQAPRGFSIAEGNGEGRRWTAAEALIEGDKILLKGAAGASAVALCRAETEQTTLRNAEDLPPAPFILELE
ncbi:MAG: hypothetical protein RL095_3456 [Verrucomicrobiota bacterium]|jgi:sialate O-acetylesterase